MNTIFLELVRLGVSPSAKIVDATFVDWLSMRALSAQQGLLAVVLDGVERCPDLMASIPSSLKVDWAGTVLQGERIKDVHDELSKRLASFYHDRGIRTYSLKGRVVAECYPNPRHRVSEDMDCYLLPEEGGEDVWEKGNALIETLGVPVDRDYYKNSTFLMPGFTVENHHYFVPFRGNAKLKAMERYLESNMRADKGADRFEGTWLCRPPVTITALFLIEHAYSHFLHEGLTWRMVLDWMLYIRMHADDIDWKEFEVRIDEFGFRRFYASFVQMGKYLLGDVTEEDLSETDKRMLADIWSPLDLHGDAKGLKKRLMLVGKTWRARWKYRAVTDMTWLRALWIQVTGVLFDKNPDVHERVD